jgi:hypothetical protein
LRLVAFLQDRSLWFDEACVALNVLERSYAELLQPLDRNQGAPVGYLFAAKLLVGLFGGSELVLRLPAFLGSLAALGLFAWVALRVLPRPAALVGLGLFAVSPHLIAYAAEAKQYSTDVTAVLVLLAVALPLLEGRPASRGRLAGLAAAGAVAVWCSHPALFVLAGLGTVLFIDRLWRKSWGEAAGLAVVGAAWLTSFAACYLVCLRHLGQNQFLRDYWAGHFLPLPPRSLSDLAWVGGKFFNLFQHPAGLGGPELSLSGLGALAFLAGCPLLARRHGLLLAALVLPLGFAMLASGLASYPFEGRLLLFAAPLLLIPVAAGGAFLAALVGTAGRGMTALTLALLFLPPVAATAHHFRERTHGEELRVVLDQLKGRWRDGDRLYVYYGAEPAFAFYGPRYGFPPEAVTTGVMSRNDRNRYHDDLDQLNGSPRVWVLFAHRHEGEERFFREHLDRAGVCRETISAPGAAAYLYDLGG